MIQINFIKLSPEISNDSHVRIHSVNTGYAEGPDLSGKLFKAIKKKNIGLLVGDGVTSYDAGEIWHLLDTRYHITVNKLDIRDFEKINLDKYTTIISPSSNVKNPSVIKKIHEWVENGGVFDWLQKFYQLVKKLICKVQEKNII